MKPLEMPHSIAAEETVLGAILVHPACFVEVAPHVQPTDFYNSARGAVFEAIVAAKDNAQAVDVVSLAEIMRARGTLERLNSLGGENYLVELMQNVVTVENIAFHAKVVQQKAERRRWVEVTSEIRAKALSDEGDDVEFSDEAQRRVFEVAQDCRRQGARSIKAVLKDSIAALERRYERKTAITGVPSGYGKLDEITAGFQPSDLVIIAARPSMGKTSLALNIAEHVVVQEKIPCLFFSLEMSDTSLGDRLICARARLDSSRMRGGQLATQDWVKISKAASEIVDTPLSILDAGSPTLYEIRAEARRWRANEKLFKSPDDLGVVFVDYLQLIQGRASKEDNRQREVSEISRGLKALAKELRCPVVALSQLSRALETRADKRPMLSDLRESGAIEQDADLVVFLYRDEVYSKDDCDDKDKGVAEIIVGKQRNGPTGTVRLAFLNAYTRFENLRYEDALAPRPAPPRAVKAPDFDERYP